MQFSGNLSRTGIAREVDEKIAHCCRALKVLSSDTHGRHFFLFVLVKKMNHMVIISYQDKI